MSEKKAIDLEFLRSVVGDDQQFERELFEIFTQNAARNIAKMEAAIKDGDSNAWYMASHAFKGAAASIGAFDLSKALEYAQKHPEDSSEDKNKIIENVKAQYKMVAEFIGREMV